MLTIKWLANNGYSYIHQTKSVTQSSDNVVHWVTLEGSPCQADDGILYVMNDNGETVAKYDFQEVPATNREPRQFPEQVVQTQKAA